MRFKEQPWLLITTNIRRTITFKNCESAWLYYSKDTIFKSVVEVSWQGTLGVINGQDLADEVGIIF